VTVFTIVTRDYRELAANKPKQAYPADIVIDVTGRGRCSSFLPIESGPTSTDVAHSSG